MTEIQSSSLPNKATLGEGYDSENEEFVGECIKGSVIYLGAQEASIEFSRSLSSTELSSELGFAIGGKARYGVTTASLSARFASEASASDYSEVTVYSSRYRFKNAKINSVELTETGRIARGTNDPNDRYTWETWETTCGHEFVDQISLGASLYICVSIEFMTSEQKQQFNAEFNIKGPAVSASAQFKEASKKFGRQASIAVSAYQLGGDVTRISQMFNSERGAGNNEIHALLRCSMENPEACLEVFNNALKYATDTNNPNAFPQQIHPDFNPNSPGGVADLTYITRPWSDLAFYQPPALLTEGVRIARETLSFEFERHLKFRNRIRILLSGGVFRSSPKQLADVRQLDMDVTSNLKIIDEAARICYSRAGDCVGAVDAAVGRLKQISEASLEVHPEVFAQWYDAKDLPNTLAKVRTIIDFITEYVKSDFVDFDRIEDKGEAVGSNLNKIETLPKSQAGPLGPMLLPLPVKDIPVFETERFNLFSFMPNLKSLHLRQCEEIERHSDRLSVLKKLEVISLLGVSPTDSLSWLGRMKRLSSIYLFYGSKGDIDLRPLSSLTNLQTLFIQGCKIDDLSPLSGLAQLRTLTLTDCSIKDARPIAAIGSLFDLDLSRNLLTDVGYLSGLNGLKRLVLTNNPLVSNVCPVANQAICEF